MGSTLARAESPAFVCESTHSTRARPDFSTSHQVDRRESIDDHLDLAVQQIQVRCDLARRSRGACASSVVALSSAVSLAWLDLVVLLQLRL